jgi:hypothetical protein
MNLPRLNLPDYDHRIEAIEGKPRIFDPARKKFVALTPEEWVRQNFIQFLIREKGVPASLVVVEMGLKLHRQQKRSDIVVFSPDAQAILIVECKSPEVNISQDTFDQIARYNMSLLVSYLVVTNGLDHYCCHINHQQKSYTFLKQIPDYKTIIEGGPLTLK